MSDGPSTFGRLYATIARRMLPAGLWAESGPEIVATFEARLAAARSRGVVRFLRFLVREMAVLRHARAEWLQTAAAPGVPAHRRGGPGSIDLHVILLATGLSLLTAIAITAVPLLATRGQALSVLLHEGSGRSGKTRANRRVRDGLVAVEVALATVTVIAAGLLGRSLLRLTSVPVGFERGEALLIDVSLPSTRYRQPEAAREFFGAVLPRLAALPGVDTAGATVDLPFTGENRRRAFDRPDDPFPEGRAPNAEYHTVTLGYLEAIGIPVVRGRSFGPQDGPGAAPVVVVNEAAARMFWPGGEAIGRPLSFPQRGETVEVTLIGVVGDVRDDGFRAAPDPLVYFSADQYPAWGMSVVVRSSVPALSLTGPVRALLLDAEPEALVDNATTLEAMLRANVARERLAAGISATVGLLTLLLAGLGIYGVVAYSVRARRREIGIRGALGAQSPAIVSLVLRHSVGLAVAGAAAGLLLGWLGARLVSSLLFGIGATDPLTYLGTPLLLVGVALAASYFPAARAVRIDPVEALRTD